MATMNLDKVYVDAMDKMIAEMSLAATSVSRPDGSSVDMGGSSPSQELPEHPEVDEEEVASSCVELLREIIHEKEGTEPGLSWWKRKRYLEVRKARQVAFDEFRKGKTFEVAKHTKQQPRDSEEKRRVNVDALSMEENPHVDSMEYMPRSNENRTVMKRTLLHNGDDHEESGDEGHQAKKQMRGTKPVKQSSETKTAPWDKVMNLIIAVDDIFERDSMEELSKLMSPAMFKQCGELQTLLAAKFQGGSSVSEQPPQASSLDTSNIPKSLAALSITPWKASEIPSQLPPLPKVMDAVLDRAAFTHQGMGGGRVIDLSYERLEWVGDSYLYLTATLLISQTFPSFLPGKCSQLRERCIKNLTLADYASQYNFMKFAKIPEEMLKGKHGAKDQDLTKIMGDIFEAYVAAVILSDPVNGLAHATDWLKKLWSMTLKKEIIDEEKHGLKYDSPMWRLRGNSGFVPIPEAERIRLGPKEQLQKLLGSKGIMLTYKDAAPEKKDKTNKLPLFTVGVYLNGYGEKDKQLGYGTANGKKDAGIKAASMALANKSLMRKLLEKKQVREKQAEQERLALEKAGGA